MKNKLFNLKKRKGKYFIKDCFDYNSSGNNVIHHSTNINFMYYYKIFKVRYIFGNRFGIKLNIYINNGK